MERQPRLVWVGQPSTTCYLVEILPWILPVLEQWDLELVAIGAADLSPRLTGGRVRTVAWSTEVEAQYLTSGAIGVAPLPESPWTRGKCGLRLLPERCEQSRQNVPPGWRWGAGRELSGPGGPCPSPVSGPPL